MARMAGEASPGKLGTGETWRSVAGEARQGKPRLGRLGEAGKVLHVLEGFGESRWGN